MSKDLEGGIGLLYRKMDPSRNPHRGLVSFDTRVFCCVGRGQVHWRLARLIDRTRVLDLLDFVVV